MSLRDQLLPRPPTDALPDADCDIALDGCKGVFPRIGLTPQETTCLVLGGHALGSAAPENSGYCGTWNPTSPHKFSNEYVGALYNNRTAGDFSQLLDVPQTKQDAAVQGKKQHVRGAAKDPNNKCWKDCTCPFSLFSDASLFQEQSGTCTEYLEEAVKVATDNDHLKGCFASAYSHVLHLGESCSPPYAWYKGSKGSAPASRTQASADKSAKDQTEYAYGQKSSQPKYGQEKTYDKED